MALSRTNDLVERKDLPPELQEQWEKDRLKKAKRKSERELARLEAALDSHATKKGGKSRKATAAAAKLDPSIEVPRQTVDMESVQQKIREFLADKVRSEMAMPACDKGTRMKIHHLATLFELGSRSKNDALGRRYTTLFKTNRSGKYVDEREVAKLMEEFKYSALYDRSDDERGGKGKGKRKDKGKGKVKDKGKGKEKEKEKGKGKLKLLKKKDRAGHLITKEGDVVGHVRARAFIGSNSPVFCLTSTLFLQAAPKIDVKNVGFMMLASMGWSDGTTIGFSGGLDAPITAVIKKTKLGLGANVDMKS